MDQYNDNSKYCFSIFIYLAMIWSYQQLSFLIALLVTFTLYEFSQNIGPVNAALVNISIIAFQKDSDPDFGESHILISKPIICLTE